MIILERKDKTLIASPDREDIQSAREEHNSSNYRDWFDDRDTWDDILANCLEYYLCNGWTLLDPNDTGDLTQAPMITDGELVWWFSNYQIIDLLDKILVQEEPVTWDYAREYEEPESD